MEIIKIEKIKLSNKEYEAFELVERCLDGILREAHDHELCFLATSTLDHLYALDNNFIEADEEEVEEPTEEHCWDERHIPSQFELNP